MRRGRMERSGEEWKREEWGDDDEPKEDRTSIRHARRFV